MYCDYIGSIYRMSVVFAQATFSQLKVAQPCKMVHSRHLLQIISQTSKVTIFPEMFKPPKLNLFCRPLTVTTCKVKQLIPHYRLPKDKCMECEFPFQRELWVHSKE